MRRSPLAIIYLTVFIDLLGFGIILPALPFYALSFGASGVWVGALLAAYSTAQLIGAPILGRLSDRIGRRPIILTSLAGSAVSLTLTGLAGSLPLLLAGRALAGLFGGSIAAAQAYIADVTEPAERAKYMGLLGAAIGMGFVLGPAIGAGLSSYGFGTAAFVAAGLAALNFVFGLFRLPESRPAGHGRAPRAHPSFATLAAGFRRPILGRLLAATFLTTLAFVGLETTFALLSAQRFGLTVTSLGLLFAYIGIVMVAVQGGLIGRLTGRFGERRVAMAGALLLSVSLLAIPFVPTLIVAALVLGLLAVGQSLVSPSLASLLSRLAGADEQGETLGIGQALAAAARAVGPLMAGWLYDRDAAWPYVTGAAVVVLAAWLVWGVPVRTSQSTPVAERVQPVPSSQRGRVP